MTKDIQGFGLPVAISASLSTAWIQASENGEIVGNCSGKENKFLHTRKKHVFPQQLQNLGVLPIKFRGGAAAGSARFPEVPQNGSALSRFRRFHTSRFRFAVPSSIKVKHSDFLGFSKVPDMVSQGFWSKPLDKGSNSKV